MLDLTPTGAGLRTQLAAEAAHAHAEKRTLIVQTSAAWCKACKELARQMGDARMRDALEGVLLVRVDLDAFASDLRALKMSKPSVPWFFWVDAKLVLRDAISADEWDANLADHMAPVLEAFVQGRLHARRAPHGTEL